MAYSVEVSRKTIARLKSSDRIGTLFAQAHARQVLQEVGESAENFPRFAPNLEDGVTCCAYELLAAACSLAEQDHRAEAIPSLEQGASLLEQLHRPNLGVSAPANCHVLVAAMAFYAAGQYSRAFVAIAKVRAVTPVAAAIGAFLRKDSVTLFSRLTDILLVEAEPPKDERELVDTAVQVALARALALMMEFAHSGESALLTSAEREIGDALVAAEAGSSPSWWWISRLLTLMLHDLTRCSPWTILRPHFPSDQHAAVAKYIRLLAFMPRPSVELWESQRAALPLVLSPERRGAVVNLRTSSGKTRVAEIAILQTLLGQPDAKVLYLAPFRSLAVEIESTLASTLGPLGYGVSHLYGGSRVSSLDTNLASEAAIVIATPEKAKALLRSTPELVPRLKLIVVDEGHLIGAETRLVRNELFLEHLRILAGRSGGRLLLLSAVLPNATELSEWIGGTGDALAKSDWKPSAERFGLLRWDGTRVRLDWRGKSESFNPSFVVKTKMRNPTTGRLNTFPKSKTEAVAATAIRLSASGPVMIFTGKARDVPSMAEAVIFALGETPAPHEWPERDWTVFEAVCEEELPGDAVELVAARLGIVCHSASLPPQVRWALERLMRAAPPRAIIATKTLGQGVNVGVASVIVANAYPSDKPIDKRDFWNICGRAGRAFVDGEGKILYAIDHTAGQAKARRSERLAEAYFAGIAGDRVESGLLFLISIMRDMARNVGVDFSRALELVAENDFSMFGDKAKTAESLCDLLDDELLALHIDPAVNQENRSPDEWVDDLLRQSLAVVQARHGIHGVSEEIALGFLKARARGAMKAVPDEGDRRAIVGSGLPLRPALRARLGLDRFREIIDAFVTTSKSFEGLVAAVGAIETWAIAEVPSVLEKVPDVAALERLRPQWLAAVGVRAMSDAEPAAAEINRQFYGYALPWIIHAVSQQLRAANDTERADVLDEMALLVEIGVPSALAARIFLAGVRSRVVAAELALFDSRGIQFANNVRILTTQLGSKQFFALVSQYVSDSARRWLELIRLPESGGWQGDDLFPAFSLKMPVAETVLHVRKVGSQIFLCGNDMRTKIPVVSTEELPFETIANNPGLAFEVTGATWNVVARDPRLDVVAFDEP